MARLFTTGIITPAGVAAAAPFRIPHGAAPTSPADGDMWTTTAGLYARVNGATVGPFSAGSGGGPTLSDTPPSSPTTGQLWYETDTGTLFVYYDSFWVEVGGVAGAFWVITSDTAPGTPVTGQMWFKSDTAQMFVYYDSFWVEVGVSSGVGALDAAVVHNTGNETIDGIKTFLKTPTASASTAGSVGFRGRNTNTGGWAEVAADAGTGSISLYATNSATGLTLIGGYSMPNSSVAVIGSLGMDVGTDGINDLHLISNGTTRVTVDSGGVVTLASSSYLVLPAATTAIPSLRIPHGAAPTAPTNGDVWTTTSGLYARVNGATVGPFSAAGMSNPLTTNGDTIYGVGTTPTRLPIGTAGQALVTNAGATAPAWTTLTLENLPGAWVKRSCRAATTANVTVASAAPSTLDGVTLAANDRILVKDQTAQAQNGIYIVQTLGTGANGVWVRAADADAIGEIASASVAVDEGTLYGGIAFDNDNKATDTLGTTAIVWNRHVDAGYSMNIGTTAVPVGRAAAALPLADVSLTLSTGSSSLTPLKFVAGPVLTTATQGAVEFDGNTAFITGDATNGSGRMIVPARQKYYLPAAAATIAAGTDFFPSGRPAMLSGHLYHFKFWLHYTKVTAGTVTWQLKNSAAVNFTIMSATAFTVPASAVLAATGNIANVALALTAGAPTPAATATWPATAILTAAVHTTLIEGYCVPSANTRLSVTPSAYSAGTLTTVLSSNYVITDLGVAGTNYGNFG